MAKKKRLFVPKNPKKQRLIALGSVLAILVSLLVALWQLGYAQDLFPSAAGARQVCDPGWKDCLKYCNGGDASERAECRGRCGTEKGDCIKAMTPKKEPCYNCTPVPSAAGSSAPSTSVPATTKPTSVPVSTPKPTPCFLCTPTTPVPVKTPAPDSRPWWCFFNPSHSWCK